MLIVDSNHVLSEHCLFNTKLVCIAPKRVKICLGKYPQHCQFAAYTEMAIQ